MRMIRTAATVALSIGLAAAAHAQTKYSSYPVGTSLKLAGSSSMHDWEMETKAISGFIEFPAGFTLDKSQAAPTGLKDGKITPEAKVNVAVRTIHSKADHLPEVMDDLMAKTLKASDFPIIQFNVKELKFTAPHAAGEPFKFDASGDLAIAGKTNAVTIPVTMEPEEGKLKVTGSIPVKMTDYGVEPPQPNFGLGMMKCGDGVTISFTWMLKEKK